MSETGQKIANVVSGDNTMGHVITAATLGEGSSAFIIWLFQLAHLDPPAAVTQFFTAACIVGASLVMRKVMGS